MTCQKCTRGEVLRQVFYDGQKINYNDYEWWLYLEWHYGQKNKKAYREREEAAQEVEKDTLRITRNSGTIET